MGIMWEFEPNQWVRISREITPEQSKDWVNGMARYLGLVSQITKRWYDIYWLEIDGEQFCWDASMFTPYKRKSIEYAHNNEDEESLYDKCGRECIEELNQKIRFIRRCKHATWCNNGKPLS